MTIISPNWLVVNTVPLETYAWQAMEDGYDDLLNTPQLRGEDLTLPGASGERPFPRVAGSLLVAVPLVIDGTRDQDGDPISNPRLGVRDHLRYLNANLGIASDGDPDDGTVPAEFHWEDGEVWQGDVIVLGLNDVVTLGRTGAMVRLDLKFPDGSMEEAGS